MAANKPAVILIAVLIAVYIVLDSPEFAHKSANFVAMRKILWSAREYERVENEEVKILFTPDDEDFVPMIERAVRLFLPALKNDFGLEKTPLPVIVIYPDEASLKKAVGLKEKNTPIGVYGGNVISILSPRLWAGEDETVIKDRFLKEGPLVHELVHYLFDIKTNGNFELWFTEGVALFYEYKYTGTEWRADLKGGAGNISLKEMSLNFRSIEQATAYRQSFEFVNNIVRQKGEDYLQEIILRLGQGGSFDNAVYSVRSGK